MSSTGLRKRKNTSNDVNRVSTQPVPSSISSIEHINQITDSTPWLTDNALVVLLTLVAAVTRFYRLDSPAAVVFDEFHFGRFQNQYNRGEYLFDIHPPLGKLTLLLAGYLAGYDPDVCDYGAIGRKFDPECKYLVLRSVSAFFGVIIIPVLFFLTRRLGGSASAAVLACVLLIFDHLNLIESRLILTDSQLMFYMTLTLYIAVRIWHRWNENEKAYDEIVRQVEREHAVEPVVPLSVKLLPSVKVPAENEANKTLAKKHKKRLEQAYATYKADQRYLTPLSRHLWLVALGVSCCAALSIKWTALTTPAVIAIESFLALFVLRRVMKIVELLEVAGVFLFLYSIFFAIHFSLLTKSSDGDAFMSIDFQRTLINSTHYDPNAPPVPFLRSLWELNAEMFAANARIDTPHHWMSKWWSWPLNLRGVLYFSEQTGNVISKVYLIGNPAVNWIVLVACAFSFAVICVCVRYRHETTSFVDDKLRLYLQSVGFCLSAYILGLLPYIAVSRAAFIYHYMPSLLYGIIVTALSVDIIGNDTVSRNVTVLITVAVVSVSMYFMPWVYSIPLKDHEHMTRQWLAGWD